MVDLPHLFENEILEEWKATILQWEAEQSFNLNAVGEWIDRLEEAFATELAGVKLDGETVEYWRSQVRGDVPAAKLAFHKQHAIEQVADSLEQERKWPSTKSVMKIALYVVFPVVVAVVSANLERDEPIQAYPPTPGVTAGDSTEMSSDDSATPTPPLIDMRKQKPSNTSGIDLELDDGGLPLTADSATYSTNEAVKKAPTDPAYVGGDPSEFGKKKAAPKDTAKAKGKTIKKIGFAVEEDKFKRVDTKGK